MTLRLKAADDLHIHLRNDDRSQTAIAAVRHGGAVRVMVMPNTDPPILTGADAIAYRTQLEQWGADFEILTTIKITGQTRPEHVSQAARCGVMAAKQYPQGVTTNSEDGIVDVRAMFPVYDALQGQDMVLSIHGEVPGVFVMDAETAFLESLLEIANNFPRLRIVLEHITTRAAVEAVSTLPDTVAATITDHHLIITLDDVVGSRIRPHHFCMPVAKRPDDRSALNEAVRSGHPKFFSGTDSAPHRIPDKQSACGCAGIFNSPYHLPILATHFKRCDMLNRLEAFTSEHGADFYRLPHNREELILEPIPQLIPETFRGLAPFGSSQELDYRIASSDADPGRTG